MPSGSWNLATIMLSFCAIIFVLTSKSLGATISTSFPLSEFIACKCLLPTDPCEEPNVSRHFDHTNETSKCSSGFVPCCYEMVIDEAIYPDGSLLLETQKSKRDTSSDFDGSKDFDYYGDDDVIENADKIFEGFITFVNRSSSSSKDDSTEEHLTKFDDYFYTDYDDVPVDAGFDIEEPATFSNSSLISVVDDDGKQPGNTIEAVSKTTEKRLKNSAPLVNSSFAPENLTNEQIEGYNDYYAYDDVIENADKIIERFIIFKNTTLPLKDIGDEGLQALFNDYSEVNDVEKATEQIFEEFTTSKNSSPVPSEKISTRLSGYGEYYYADDDVIGNADKIVEGNIIFKNSTSYHETVSDEMQPALFNDYYIEEETFDKLNKPSTLSEIFKNSSLAIEQKIYEEQPLIHNDRYKSDKDFAGPETFINGSLAVLTTLVDPLPEHNYYYTDDDVIKNADKIIEGYITIKNSSSTPSVSITNEEQSPAYNDYYADYDYPLQNRSVPDNKFLSSSKETRTDLDVSATALIKTKNLFDKQNLTHKQKQSRAISHSISHDHVSDNYDPLKPLASSIYNSSVLLFKFENDSTIVEISPNKLTEVNANLKFDGTSEILLNNNYPLLTKESTSQMGNRSYAKNNSTIVTDLSSVVANEDNFEDGTSVSTNNLWDVEQVMMSTSNPNFGYTMLNYGEIINEPSPVSNCPNFIENCVNKTSMSINEYDTAAQGEGKEMFATTTVGASTTSNDSFIQRFFNNFFISSSFETVESTLESEKYLPASISLIQGNNTIVNQSSSNLSYESIATSIDYNNVDTTLNDTSASLTYVNQPLPGSTNQKDDVDSKVHFNPGNNDNTINTSMTADRRYQIREYDSASPKASLLDRNMENVPRTLPPIHIRSPHNFTFPVNEGELSTPKPRKITSFLDWIFGHL